jgi:hypothetical protein
MAEFLFLSLQAILSLNFHREGADKNFFFLSFLAFELIE